MANWLDLVREGTCDWDLLIGRWGGATYKEYFRTGICHSSIQTSAKGFVAFSQMCHSCCSLIYFQPTTGYTRESCVGLPAESLDLTLISSATQKKVVKDLSFGVKHIWVHTDSAIVSCFTSLSLSFPLLWGEHTNSSHYIAL